MATLTAGTGFATLARILHAAASVGPGSWDRKPGKAEPASEPALSDDLLALFTLLRDRGTPYLLVGGVALLRYIDGRNTDDIDLLLSVESLAKLPEIVVGDRNKDFARGTFRTLRVDLLLTANPLFKQVQDRHATTHRFRELEVRCATVEGLVLLKLYALPSLYRQGDLQKAALYEADITMLCHKHRPEVAPLLAAVRPHVEAGQFEELSAIARDIAERVARMGRASGH